MFVSTRTSRRARHHRLRRRIHIHWLFIVAAVLALVRLVSLFTGAAGGRSRGAW